MSDYIMNRESLKQHCEAVCKKFKDVPTSGTYGEHRLVLDLLQQTEWIPVSDRLPEKNVEVLATTSWDAVTIAEMYSANDWFIHEGTTNAETDEIVAWMPLPEPYKAESEEV